MLLAYSWLQLGEFKSVLPVADSEPRAKTNHGMVWSRASLARAPFAGDVRLPQAPDSESTRRVTPPPPRPRPLLGPRAHRDWQPPYHDASASAARPRLWLRRPRPPGRGCSGSSRRRCRPKGHLRNLEATGTGGSPRRSESFKLNSAAALAGLTDSDGAGPDPPGWFKLWPRQFAGRSSCGHDMTVLTGRLVLSIISSPSH